MECAMAGEKERRMARGSAQRASDRVTPPVNAAAYLARVGTLAPALAAAVGEIDRRRELPEPIVEQLVENGLFRLLLPRSLDGAELLPAEYVPIIEAIA